MVVQYSRKKKDTKRKRVRQQGGIKGKKVFFFLGRTGNAHSTAKLPILANSELLSGQASRVENLTEYFCVSKSSAVSQEKGGRAASQCSCCNSALSTQCALRSVTPGLLPT